MEDGEDFAALPPERRRDRLKALARRSLTVPLYVRTGDLPKRTASAVVMLAVAGGALWVGGIVRDALFLLIGLACVAEMVRLVWRATMQPAARFVGIAAGTAYIGTAVYLMTRIDALPLLLLLIGTVICIDTFAYFFGRTLGGPRIAPRISPSKTWAGLLGGVVGAILALAIYTFVGGAFGSGAINGPASYFPLVLAGAALAIVAQSGDFLESWLKRKAGMKDSSNLIPGHGGVFDRIDGLIPVTILVGSVLLAQYPHWLGE